LLQQVAFLFSALASIVFASGLIGTSSQHGNVVYKIDEATFQITVLQNLSAISGELMWGSRTFDPRSNTFFLPLRPIAGGPVWIYGIPIAGGKPISKTLIGYRDTTIYFESYYVVWDSKANMMLVLIEAGSSFFSPRNVSVGKVTLGSSQPSFKLIRTVRSEMLTSSADINLDEVNQRLVYGVILEHYYNYTSLSLTNLKEPARIYPMPVNLHSTMFFPVGWDQKAASVIMSCRSRSSDTYRFGRWQPGSPFNGTPINGLGKCIAVSGAYNDRSDRLWLYCHGTTTTTLFLIDFNTRTVIKSGPAPFFINLVAF